MVIYCVEHSLLRREPTGDLAPPGVEPFPPDEAVRIPHVDMDLLPEEPLRLVENLVQAPKA